MSTINDGGPAFPIPGLQHDADFNGITLRDYFAAKAMQGWTANPLPNDTPINEIAEWAYRQADAMIKARYQKGGAA
jgi:hypothetical protein